MKAYGKYWLVLSNVIIFFILFFSIGTAAAGDTISPGQAISGNQTLVSKGGNFELGFFSPGNSSSHNYYLGIWFKNIQAHDIIWVANRKNPISNPSNSMLKVSQDGNLVLFHQSGSPVWSSNSTASTSNSTIVELLDNGNLVIRNSSNVSTPIWQSFEHPSHTWMPGAPLGVNKQTGEFQTITSWKSSDDPSPGLFSLSLAPDKSSRIVVLYNGSRIYVNTGVWNGQFFSLLPEVFMEKNFYNFSFVDNEHQKYAAYILLDPSQITYTLMDPSGQVKQLSWLSGKQQWLLNYNQPPALCDVYSACGPFGFCDQKSTPSCNCYPGFEPASKEDWDLGTWSSGCSRKHSFQCNNKDRPSTTGDGFFEMKMVRLPSNPLKSTESRSAGECEGACRHDCSCTAYAFDDQCSIWHGDLENVEQLYDGDEDDSAGTLSLRLATSDIPASTNNIPPPTSNSNSALAVIPIVVPVVTVVLGCVALLVGLILWARRRRSARMAKQVEGSLFSFTYADLQRMTKNFSDVLGRGGFGLVFKGALPDSTIIAVKKLQGLWQGEKQFRAEVSTLGSIQHVNLVRLRGFCCEGSKRLLVYDYMSGGSLDTYLFKNGKDVLDWKTRYQIILGVARGLAYLHEKCRECIIHCDIKPENILLDDEFRPKVADFGMAKLMDHDFSRVLTTMRGTIGYLAPEWISGLPMTVKVDVYSFGMMLFELMSGERNNCPGDDGMGYFPLRAVSQIVDGNVSDLLDKRLQGEADREEWKRVCNVACWCIQDSDADRPTMGQVVQILEGVLDVPVPPFPRYLQSLMDGHDSMSYV